MKIESLRVGAYKIPTDAPESDGTLQWDATTLVLVRLDCQGHTGLGYSYAHAAIAGLIDSKLRPVVEGRDPFEGPALWSEMLNSLRNMGRPGLTSYAVAAVDVALWDLRARLLGLSLVDLLGRARRGIPIYGSGGFTSYSLSRLREQLGGWVDQGISMVKMKVGRQAEEDPERVRVARQAIGDQAELFVDANGGYRRKQALELGKRFREEAGVSWFEEPVP
ncbi:MAG: mandelate racemase, partial [Candidatus Eremiobacteraeota bacterium]|nr:mandelate racemase [Candidatus Eremiobacteraeota bacterium]